METSKCISFMFSDGDLLIFPALNTVLHLLFSPPPPPEKPEIRYTATVFDMRNEWVNSILKLKKLKKIDAMQSLFFLKNQAATKIYLNLESTNNVHNLYHWSQIHECTAVLYWILYF